MSAPFPRRSAAELTDATFVARWADRSAIGPAARTALRDAVAELDAVRG